MHSLEKAILQELDSIPLVDPHSHIDPRSPASSSIADLLGYHYYTELAHSAGMPRARIEEPSITGLQKVERLFERLHEIEHTVQWSWFLDIASELLDFPRESVNREHWRELFDRSTERMQQAGWAEHVLRESKVEKIFLTNDFDDALSDFDTNTYVPCLRTDDLVFKLHLPQVQSRFEAATGRAPSNLKALCDGIDALFQRFKSRGAKACAISLPPWFTPIPLLRDDREVEEIWQRLLRRPNDCFESDLEALSLWVFWRLAEYCVEYRMPFDLMIGVNRSVYPGGVYQGQDLYDSRWSMIQYRELFNAFPNLKFPISVLASVSNQELVDYAWIFPNVIPHGHWWYSNTPTFIEHDLRARLDAVPRNKLIGYYSDAYKLEFILPKFWMYKKILSKVLAQTVCGERGKSETFAVELGKQILRGNVDSIFFDQE